MPVVRIGFIGCGFNAKVHMATISGMTSATIVAVSDLSETAATEAAAVTGGRWYTDYRNMLDAEELDAVFLSIPVFAHGVPEIDIIERDLKATPPAGANIDLAFIEAVRTGDRQAILSDYADGVRSLAVSVAAMQSARTGQPVKMRDVLQGL